MPKKTSFALALFTLTAVSVALATAPAGAADINDPYYNGDRGAFNAEPYDDPRYADMYGDPDPRYGDRDYAEDKIPYRDDAYRAPKQHRDNHHYKSKDYSGKDYADDDWKGYADKDFSGRFDDRDGYTPKGSLKDDGYLREFDAPPKYSEAPRRGYACVGRRQIRRILHADGWGPIRRIILRGRDEAIVFARRNVSGRAYAIRFDRCDCKITEARPLHLRRFGPWAWHTPRRHGRRHY